MNWLLSLVDDPLTETTAMLVEAYGVYLLADNPHVSSILAVIVMGLLIGSLPDRDLLATATYGVVHFTLMVQGLTLRTVLRQLGFSPGASRTSGSGS